MKFFDTNLNEIHKAQAATTVLAVIDKDGNSTGKFINYHGVTVAALNLLGAKSVAIFCNHAGNNECTQSFMHNGATSDRVARINKALGK